MQQLFRFDSLATFCFCFSSWMVRLVTSSTGSHLLSFFPVTGEMYDALCVCSLRFLFFTRASMNDAPFALFLISAQEPFLQHICRAGGFDLNLALCILLSQRSVALWTSFLTCETCLERRLRSATVGLCLPVLATSSSSPSVDFNKFHFRAK